MRKSIYFLLLIASFLNAAKISSIEYKGLIHISPSSANQIAGIKIGQDLTPKLAHEAIVNLYSQGYFKDIFIEQDNGKVIINVKEKPIIAKIQLEGVATNDKKAINQIFNIHKGETYDEAVIKAAKERIVQFYEAKGYFDTIVNEEKENLNENSLKLTFFVNRGENIIIKDVNLVGSKVLDYGDIEPNITNKQREFLGWMWGRNDGKLNLYTLPNDPEKIKEQYLKRGYLDAEISNPYLNAYFDNYTADLSYFINEGKAYKVGDISLNVPEFLNLDNEKILKDFILEKGDKARSKWLHKDKDFLENLVANKGYAFVKVNQNLNKDKENGVVDINYEVYPGDKVYIRNIVIAGNKKTADRIIRRELYLTEGHLFNQDDLRDSKNALRRTGYFEDVNIEQKRVAKNKMDLIIKVKEARTGNITGGIGYGTSDGFLINLGLSDSNIFGGGYSGSINVDKSDDKLAGSISLTNPRVNDSAYSLGGSIYAQNNESEDDYKEENMGARVIAGRALGRYTHAYLSYQIQKSKISGLDEFYKKAGYLNGNNIKSALTPSISFNNTDDYLIPRSGIITGTSFEYAGLGGDIEFIKNQTNFNWYQGIRDYTDWDLILRYKANFAYIWNNNQDKLPINEKLLLGGIDSVRGFESGSLSPRKKIYISGQGCKDIKTGGKMAFSNSFELSFPIIDRIKMRGALFFDYGMIGEDSLNEIKRYSTGLQIEWVTMLGPVQFVFAKPLNDKAGDDTSSFEFSIGRRF